MAPRVSVVIPSFNYGHFVVEAVESVLAQTYTDYEVIVVDDGSTDDTRERLAPVMDRIRYIYQENRGLSGARNRGISEARGEFIGLLDSDDQWHAQFLEIVMPLLESDLTLGLLGCRKTTDTEFLSRHFDAHKMSVTRIGIESFVTTHPIAPSAVVIRRSVFDEVGLFDTSLRSVEDRDMWIRIALACKTGYVDLPLMWSRQHVSGMSSPANTVRMEHFDRLVLERAFADRRLERRQILRRRAFSVVGWTCAVGYREAGLYAQAWRSVARAVYYWPLSYGQATQSWSLGQRLRFVAILMVRHVKAVLSYRVLSQPPKAEVQN